MKKCFVIILIKELGTFFEIMVKFGNMQRKFWKYFVQIIYENLKEIVEKF